MQDKVSGDLNAFKKVVDDAIVVVEAVQARFDVGYQSSYMATNDADVYKRQLHIGCSYKTLTT